MVYNMGGAIAIELPLGISGIRLPGTLTKILNLKKAKYGLTNLFCGGGQGIAPTVNQFTRKF